jgi:signal transduction histidine kinase
LLDTLGHARQPGAAAWIEQLGRDAWIRSAPQAAQHTGGDTPLRANARPVRRSNGTGFVAVAVADEIELEDRYTSLILAFAAAGLAALVLVSGGGWIIARQATAPVERAIDNMRRFVADAAHELRTPAAVIRSRADVALQRSRSPEDYIRALRSIETESARLGRIVEDLLTLARADARERPIERTRLFLDDVVLDAADAARAIADAKGVQVQVGDFQEAPVAGDAGLLHQLVMILLDNGIKFTPRGGTVRVDVRPDGTQVTLAVTDTGVGIAPEHLPHVFERFFRGDPSRTRDQEGDSEGAGLGLSIADWIVEAHGGSISAQSEMGKGTRLSVVLPVDVGQLSSS